MPKFYSLEKPPVEEVKKLTKELKEGYPNLKPRLTFNFPLNENRRGALEMIKSGKIDEVGIVKLLESNDFVEIRAVLYLLEQSPRVLKKDTIEKATLLLGKLSQDKSRGNLIRQDAIFALGNLGEMALPVLGKLSQDEEWDIRTSAIAALGEVGKMAMPILEKLRQDKNSDIEYRALLALSNLSEKARPLLNKVFQDENSGDREIQSPEDGEDVGGHRSWLLATKKPLFATPYSKDLAERLQEIDEVLKKLKDKFGDKFIGLTIFGSTAKGYLGPGSDLDWAIVAKDYPVAKEFQKIAETLPFPLCHEYYADVGDKNKVRTEPQVLFYGLFFGDHNKLQSLQKATLESMTKKEWDKIREDILENETSLFKAQQKYGLKDDELKKIKQFVSLLRVPPSYEETLEIVKKRAKE